VKRSNGYIDTMGLSFGSWDGGRRVLDGCPKVYYDQPHLKLTNSG